MRRLLDVATAMPDRDGVGVVDACMPELRRTLEVMTDRSTGSPGFDWDVAEAVAHALLPLVEDPRARVHGWSHHRYLAGAVVGALIAAGGRASYGRYMRRFGAIVDFLRHGLPGMASAALADRSAFHALHGVDGFPRPGIPSSERATISGRAGGSPLALPAPVVGGTPSPSSSASASATSSAVVAAPPVVLSPLAVGDAEVRRVTAGDALLFHAHDAFVAFGYRHPKVSLSQFLAKNRDADVAREVVLESGGHPRATKFLTVAGMVLCIAQMGSRAAGRGLATKLAAGLLSRLLPDNCMAGDVRVELAYRQLETLAEATRRRWAAAEARASRLDSVVGAQAAELAVLRQRAEEADVSRVVAAQNAELRTALLAADAAVLRARREVSEGRLDAWHRKAQHDSTFDRAFHAERDLDAAVREREAALAEARSLRERLDASEQAARRAEAERAMEAARADLLENELYLANRDLAESAQNLATAKEQLREAIMARGKPKPPSGGGSSH